MKVILLEKIGKLGQLGDAVDVKPGYARNYLIPQKKALYATDEAIQEIEQRRAELIKEEKDRLDVAQARADSAVKSLTIARNVVNDEGKLFGSVTASDIVAAAEAAGTEFIRSEIQMPDGNIKNTGEYQVQVALHPEVCIDISVSVTAGSLTDSVEDITRKSDEVEEPSDDANQSSEDVEDVNEPETAPSPQESTDEEKAE